MSYDGKSGCEEEFMAALCDIAAVLASVDEGRAATLEEVRRMAEADRYAHREVTMPFLRFKNAHEPCGARIADYLERRGRWSGRRPAGHDYIGLFTDDGRRAWDRVMDATRSAAGNGRPWRGRDPVTYKRFVISPDPRDGVDLKTLRSLATEWAREFFGDGEAPGRVGCYEVAIVYHDDNEARIPHAHVIVNGTDLLTGRRIQVDPSMIKGRDGGEVFTRLQEISAEHGLRHFGDGRVRRGDFDAS